MKTHRSVEVGSVRAQIEQQLWRLVGQGRVSPTLARGLQEEMNSFYRDPQLVRDWPAVLEMILDHYGTASTGEEHTLETWKQYLSEGTVSAGRGLDLSRPSSGHQVNRDLALHGTSPAPILAATPMPAFGTFPLLQVAGDSAEYCCVDTLDYPRTIKTLGVANRGDVLVGTQQKAPMVPCFRVGFRFTAEALFTPDSDLDCACHCCEFRQERIALIRTDESHVHPRLKEGTRLNGTFKRAEDSAVHDGVAWQAYGHREHTAGVDASGREGRASDGYFKNPATAADEIAAVDAAPTVELRYPKTPPSQTLHDIEVADRDLKLKEGDEDRQGKSLGADGSQRTRRAACYYFMVDTPQLLVYPGTLTYAFYMFLARIQTSCAGLFGPRSNGFMVMMRIDWRSAGNDVQSTAMPAPPDVGYQFNSIGGARVGVDFGIRVESPHIERALQSEELEIRGDTVGGDEVLREWRSLIHGHVGDVGTKVVTR